MNLRNAISILVLGLASLLGVTTANAKAFYVAASSGRNAGGTSCNDALSVAWFNNSSSWGSSSHQISTGTTVFLCGRFSGAAGQQLLAVQGNGVTIKFALGAILSAPYWATSGAINIDNRSNVVVDGGTNGVIENTQNGTGRAYQKLTVAIHAVSCTGCTVQNLTIQNLYVRTSNTDYAPDHTSHCVFWLNANQLTINNITCHDACWAIAGYGNNFTLANSNIYHVDHGVASGPAQ